MYARVLEFVTLFTQVLLSTCVKVTEYHGPDIISNIKIELKPIYISASLGDMIIISAPIIKNNTLYFLNKPNGITMKLNLNINHIMFDNKKINDDYNDIIEQNVREELKAIFKNKYKIINNSYESCYNKTDSSKDKERNLMENDFGIGPLGEEDHGNWILSAFYTENDGEWTELFQVITIEIIEAISTYPSKPKLDQGKDLELRFVYPIKDLQSCEIIAPRTTFDRFYDRIKSDLESCGFRIPNVTKEDEGPWKIIGVGRIVYEASVHLEII